jgi:hypothetical protein
MSLHGSITLHHSQHLWCFLKLPAVFVERVSNLFTSSRLLAGTSCYNSGCFDPGQNGHWG